MLKWFNIRLCAKMQRVSILCRVFGRMDWVLNINSFSITYRMFYRFVQICRFGAQVLRILEGDMLMDTNYASPGYDVGNRSGRIWADQQQHYSGPMVNEALVEGFSGKLSLDGLRPGARRSSCEAN